MKYRTDDEKRKLIEAINRDHLNGIPRDASFEKHGVHKDQFYQWSKELSMPLPRRRGKNALVKPKRIRKKPMVLDLPEVKVGGKLFLVYGDADALAQFSQRLQ